MKRLLANGKPRKGTDVFDIDREHPELHVRGSETLAAVSRPVRGRRAVAELNAQDYLVRRQREPGDVYAERLSRVFYENYIGSIVDWYAATLFRREPVLTFEGDERRGQGVLSRALVDDVDRKGTALADFFRQQFIESLVTGASYVLVDFPRAAAKAGSRAEEDALGASRAYLVDYAAEDLINWSLDEQGNFEWVVLRTELLRKDRVEDPEWRTETRWAYYDKQTFRIYRAGADGTSGAVALVDEGTHGLAKLNAGAVVRAADSGRVVDAEPGGVCCNWSTSTNRTRCRGR